MIPDVVVSLLLVPDVLPSLLPLLLPLVDDELVSMLDGGPVSPPSLFSLRPPLTSEIWEDAEEAVRPRSRGRCRGGGSHPSTCRREPKRRSSLSCDSSSSTSWELCSDILGGMRLRDTKRQLVGLQLATANGLFMTGAWLFHLMCDGNSSNENQNRHRASLAKPTSCTLYADSLGMKARRGFEFGLPQDPLFFKKKCCGPSAQWLAARATFAIAPTPNSNNA